MPILRNKPILSYSGITIILSNPSRMDERRLLSGNGGQLMNDILAPDYNLMQVDIRVMEDKSPFLSGTRVIICLGEFAMKDWITATRQNTLNEMRGSPFYINGIPAIASFFPQDAVDVVNHESKHNKLSKEYTEADGETEYSSETDDDEEGDVKQHSSTKQSNYYFWLKKDIEKCKRLLMEGSGRWLVEKEPIYKIYPDENEVIQTLSTPTGQYFDFDIETDYEEQNLLCFAYGFRPTPFDYPTTIYSVPILDYNYRLAYSSWPSIIRALGRALYNNIVVGHNIAAFDLLVLSGYKYHLPFRFAEDTMRMFKRCFPDIEQSLGHMISLWTNQVFHKDEDSRAYTNYGHMNDKLRYCAKDVFGTALVHRAIHSYSKTIPGLADSIALANRSIKPYLCATLQGIRFDDEKRKRLCDENDRLMMQYLRIIKMLIGDVGLLNCQAALKGKRTLFTPSNAQLCNYFYEQLGYQPVGRRSEKTGKSSLGAKNLYKLALQYNNPVITMCLLYRGVQKEYSSLMFNPWKRDDGTVFPRRKAEVEV